MTGIGSMLCLVLIAAVLAEATAVDYCNPKLCKPGETHTMCKYKTDKVAAACGKVLKNGLTKDDKKDIVKVHNELRQKVASGGASPQPPADSMPDLVWDDELAEIAQRWTIQCTGDHDKCSNVERFHVGQNLAEGESSEDDIEPKDLVQDWYNEIKLYDPKEVSKYIDRELDPDEETGHYTQLVWAGTTKVGCGFIKSTDGEMIKSYMICNYGPGGNVEGEPVYIIKKKK